MYIFVRGFSRAYKIYNRGGIYLTGLITGIIIIIIIIIYVLYIVQVFMKMIKCALHW